MHDWSLFRETVQRGDRRCVQLRILRQIEAWLDLASEQAVAAIRQEIADVERALLFRNSLSIIRLKLQRDGSIPLAEAQPRLQELFAAVDAGRASEAERGFAQRMIVSWQLSQTIMEIHPSLTDAVSEAELAQSRLRRAISHIHARVAKLPPSVIAPGSVTQDHLTALSRLVSEYGNLAAATEDDNPALPELYWHMGSTARMLANGCSLLGSHNVGLDWYAKAAEWFGRSGSPADVDDCRRRADDLRSRLGGDLDSPTQRSIASLVAEPPAGADPLARAAALVEVVNTRLEVDDVLEAGRYADDAAAALTRAGFCDPLPVGLDAAFDDWIETASRSTTGLAFEARIQKVLTFYAAILSARCSSALRENPEKADQAYRTLREIGPLQTEIAAETEAANAELEREWAVYSPEAVAASVDPDPDRPSPLQEMRSLDDALLQLRQECNRRNETNEPREDLIERAVELQSHATALRMPLYEAKACLERAYVLGHIGRPAELIAAAREAQNLILAGRPATLSSFSQSFERAVYLDALTRQTMGQAVLGDFEAAFTTCEEMIRDAERLRYHVNSPFQQSAFLAQVKFFYQIGAFAAFKQERWDEMLECMELLKARAAIRSRMMGEPVDQSFTDLERQFREASDALDRTRAAGVDNEDLAVRRRWLRDLLAMARARPASGSPALPDLRLVDVQASLAADEAAISYFWLTDTTILVLLIDRDRFHAERIPLASTQRQRLDEFLATIQGLSVLSTKGPPAPLHSLDGVVTRLGAVLFPAFCRNFVAGKKRLILSPNQGLHLFPFHAARWEDDFLGERYAIRYVPNLSSLLLPWNGPLDGRVLAIGVPDCGVPGYATLNNAAAEVDDVRQCYEAHGVPVDVLMGEEASRERIGQMGVNGQLRSYRCVHLATHGVSVFESPVEPMESRLLLFRSNLDSMDVAELRISAELAVLSACNSGQRAFARGTQALAGDDVFGLQQALFQSGVRTVLGSLWPVETDSAQIIVRAFHRHFAAGSTPEVALQSAVGEYLRDADWRYIYYWAPFFLTSLGSMAPVPFSAD